MGYGGTERVVSYLTEELVRCGHRVTLFASGDSRTDARLVPVAARPLRARGVRADQAHVELLRELDLVFARAEEFDLIHCHVDYEAFSRARLSRTPTLHTLHGRLDLPHLAAIYREFDETPLVSISQAQRTALAPLEVNWMSTVHHGLPLALYPYSPVVGDYLLFLGRISPEKRPDLAIEVAKRAGIRLKIAAKVDAADREYFARVIRAAMDHPLIEFLGEVDQPTKLPLLRGARALIFPIDWPEPFGLVMIEAMACGTPVVARPLASVPEVVVDGHTGFLATSVDELVEAVREVGRLDRAECRRHVEQRFSVQQMATRYEAIYRRLVGAAHLAAARTGGTKARATVRESRGPHVPARLSPSAPSTG